jgi:hypothetical protein
MLASNLELLRHIAAETAFVFKYTCRATLAVTLDPQQNRLGRINFLPPNTDL